MSELSSLIAKITISSENLEEFLAAPVATFENQKGWQTWWDSRDMYGKSALTPAMLQPFRKSTNRDVVDEWLSYLPSITHSEYDTATQTWYFSSMQFSENYTEMISMLGFLRSIDVYKMLDDSDFVLVFPFIWGDDDAQAYIRFTGNESYFSTSSDSQHLQLAKQYLHKRWSDFEAANPDLID